MKKKIISFILVLTIFTTTLHKLGIAKVYADNDNIMQMTEIDESLIYTPNERSAVLVSSLISTYAVPVAINVATVGIIGLGIAQTIDPMQVRTLLTGLGKGTNTNVKNYFQEKIASMHMATVGYLVLAGAYGTDTFSDVEGEMEESGWTPQFIQSVKDDIGGGSSGGDSGDQEPKNKIDWKSMVKYGVTALLTSTFLIGVWNFIKNILSDTSVSGSTDGTFPPLLGVTSTPYRWVDLPVGSSTKYTANNAFKIRASADLNMNLVEQVKIYMYPVQLYNYGWEGSVHYQEYLLKGLDGTKFVFTVFIGKALSPNQYSDMQSDGLAYIFYQLNDDMTPYLMSEHNFQNYRVDTERLSIDAKMTSYLKSKGFIPYTSSYNMSALGDSSDWLAFTEMRERIKTALGTDLFPEIASDVTMNPFSPSSLSFVDLSKGVPGTYNNKWEPIEGVDIIPSFDSGSFDVTLPSYIPGF